MHTLILLRHGESQWNLENRFTGWVDIDLSARGETEAHNAGKMIRSFPIDYVFTSVLKRATRTAQIALDEAEKFDLPTERNEALNERHYGDLQGMNKAETTEQFGSDQVKTWRRSYDVPPPNGESLKMTQERVLPYFISFIEPKILAGKTVLVVAHGNSLRSLVAHLERLTKEEILELNIPTGIPLVYELKDDLSVAHKSYLSLDRDDEEPDVE